MNLNNRSTQVAIALAVLVAVLVAVLFWRGCSNQDNLAQQVALYEATQDTLKASRDKDGLHVAEIALLVANSEKDLLKIESQDATIQQLQGVVKDYKGKLSAATVASTLTTDDGTTVTMIGRVDTVVVNGGVKVYPVYHSEWDEQWSRGTITASKDSVSRSIFVRNDFEITQGYEKQGLFKPKKAVVKIKNLNPYTETEELRSFVVEPKNKRISIGVGAMYGIDLIGLKPTIVVGVGAQWSIIKL